MNIQGILWDNDGLLVDTERLYFEANRLTLERAGITLTRERYVDHNLRHGKSLMDLAREAGKSEPEVEALRQKRDAAYLELLRKGVTIMPGVEAVLAELAGRVRMGIVTSSQPVHFEAIHSTSGLLRYFEFVIALGDYKRGKPHPEPYLQGLSRLGLPASKVIAVEDSERGLRSATAAGLRCVVVPNEQTRLGDFTGAAAVLTDLSSLPAFLAALPA